MLSVQANSNPPMIGPKDRNTATNVWPRPLTVPLVAITVELLTKIMVVVVAVTLKGEYKQITSGQELHRV